MKINIISQQIDDILPSPPPWHSGVQHANSVLDWLPTDTKESFEKMMQDPAHREYFSNLGWDKLGTITYKINSYGFRSEEFEIGSDSIVALGCSYTHGTGLPIEATWPSLVGKHLGLKVYNLAWGGTSADTCFMVGQYWIPVLKPKLVVMAAPPKDRIDITLATGHPEFQTILPATTVGEFGSDNFIKHWFANERNGQLNNAKNKLAVKALSNNLGIPCLTYNAHDWFAKSREEVGYARDYMHAGPRGHEILAERIINDFATTK